MNYQTILLSTAFALSASAVTALDLDIGGIEASVDVGLGGGGASVEADVGIGSSSVEADVGLGGGHSGGSTGGSVSVGLGGGTTGGGSHGVPGTPGTPGAPGIGIDGLPLPAVARAVQTGNYAALVGQHLFSSDGARLGKITGYRGYDGKMMMLTIELDSLLGFGPRRVHCKVRPQGDWHDRVTMEMTAFRFMNVVSKQV